MYAMPATIRCVFIELAGYRMRDSVLRGQDGADMEERRHALACAGASNLHRRCSSRENSDIPCTRIAHRDLHIRRGMTSYPLLVVRRCRGCGVVPQVSKGSRVVSRWSPRRAQPKESGRRRTTRGLTLIGQGRRVIMSLASLRRADLSVGPPIAREGCAPELGLEGKIETEGAECSPARVPLPAPSIDDGRCTGPVIVTQFRGLVAFLGYNAKL